MPSRRETIRMGPVEVQDYLLGHSRIILVTNGSDGLPHPVPMNYGLDEEGHILISSFRKSQKVRNLERDPRAALLVESGETYADLKSVIAYADAEIIGDAEMVASLMRNIRADGALAGSMTTGMSEQIRASIAKRVVLRFTPFRHVSWDHTKLSGYY
jgi:nitroimidazol reductase NimA-like FMN-containing flavoprotein (pyridoxamine 5'-phosphate oxidase superfamily)